MGQRLSWIPLPLLSSSPVKSQGQYLWTLSGKGALAIGRLRETLIRGGLGTSQAISISSMLQKAKGARTGWAPIPELGLEWQVSAHRAVMEEDSRASLNALRHARRQLFRGLILGSGGIKKVIAAGPGGAGEMVSGSHCMNLWPLSQYRSLPLVKGEYV